MPSSAPSRCQWPTEISPLFPMAVSERYSSAISKASLSVGAKINPAKVAAISFRLMRPIVISSLSGGPSRRDANMSHAASRWLSRGQRHAVVHRDGIAAHVTPDALPDPAAFGKLLGPSSPASAAPNAETPAACRSACRPSAAQSRTALLSSRRTGAPTVQGCQGANETLACS
jgi:hypothetical protein